MTFAIITAAAALFVASVPAVNAQVTSTTRIPIQKEGPATTGTAGGTYYSPATDTTVYTDTTYSTIPDTMGVYYVPTGATCSSVDRSAAAAVQIKTSLYDPSTMISPDSAKVIALCAIPGQIGSGEMNVGNGRTEYAIDIIPNHKKTHSKVIVDAETGAVMSTKQFGGARGAAGWVRESLEHRKNTKP